MLASAGAKPVTVRAMLNTLLTIAAPFVPILRELRETLYQFTSPYVMGSPGRGNLLVTPGSGTPRRWRWADSRMADAGGRAAHT